ncbi:MAG: hypothetical protein HY347_08820 [candidate division NC10 bacterium]|nr:hypothetical protein [candidate division NC10 bacterium]
MSAQQKIEELRNASTFPPVPVSPAPPMTDAPSPGFTRRGVVSSVTGARPSRRATEDDPFHQELVVSLLAAGDWVLQVTEARASWSESSGRGQP